MISVIIPVYNEEQRIETNVNLLLKLLGEFKEEWELIIVDDGSKDDSLKIIQNLVKDNSHVNIIHYSKNRGRGYALRTGFSAFKGDIIVTTESDLSWGPEIVKQLVDSLKNTNSDIVIASPYKTGGKLVNIPFRRRFLSRWGNKVMTLATGGNLTMISGMTRAYKKEVIESLDLESDGKEIHLEIISKSLTLGFRVVEIPAVLRWEDSKSRKSSFNTKKFVFSHLLFSFNETPFLFLGTLSLILIAIGIIVSFFVMYFWYADTLRQHTLISVSSIVFLIVGIQIMVFSFLANQNRDIRKQLVRMQRDIILLKKQKK